MTPQAGPNSHLGGVHFGLFIRLYLRPQGAAAVRLAGSRLGQVSVACLSHMYHSGLSRGVCLAHQPTMCGADAMLMPCAMASGTPT